MIEYAYESQALIAWLDHLLDSTLTYAGISPQSVGRSVDGGATSGTALRLKMNHTLIEAAGKGRHFDRGLRRLLHFAQLLDSRPTTQGGFGRRWSTPDEPPTIDRHDGLIRDDSETAKVLATLIGAEAISVERAVEEWNEDWTPAQVEEEVARIRSEHASGPDSAPTISTVRPDVIVPSQNQ